MAKPKTSEAQLKAAREYKNRNLVDGIVQTKVRVPEHRVEDIRKIAEKMRLEG